MRPPYRNAAIVIAIAATMASLLVTSYSLALARPTPHHIPAGLVGEEAGSTGLVTGLEAATHDGLALRRYGSAASAERAVAEQRIYAALELERGSARLLIASASGVSVARVLEQAAEGVSRSTSYPLSVVDLHPLPDSDPEGLVPFYATLAATILGFLTMFQLQAHASQLSLRGRLTCIVTLAAVGGLLLTLVTDPVTEALNGPFLELWPAYAAEVTTAALFSATMLALIGPWAILPTWALFVVLGNASSGGAVAPPLLPPFYSFIGRFLPNGATVETVRNAVYFRHTQHLEPIVLEAVWIVCTFAALMLATRYRSRGGLRSRPTAPTT